MLVLNTIVGAFVSRLGIGSFGNHVPAEDTDIPTAPADDQAVEASLAHLLPEERQRRIQVREWYQRLARRQGIIEIEENANNYWRSDSEQ
jgi:hypothetical protein